MSDNWDSTAQSKRFHAPLRDGDTQEVTLGCRHTNPDICRSNSMPGSCAFAQSDGICRTPPKSWPRQFAKLRGTK